MTRELLAAGIMVWLVGALVGWVAGWVVRGDENRRWVASARRRIDYAESQARDAVAELDRVTAQRLDAERWASPPAPEIHVHVQAAPGLGYHGLTGAPAPALAAQLPRVLEASP